MALSFDRKKAKSDPETLGKIGIPKRRATDNSSSFRHVVFTVQNTSDCFSIRTWYCEQCLETQANTFCTECTCRGFLRRQFEKFLNSSEAECHLRWSPTSNYCRGLVRRKLGFGCIFLIHERKLRIGHWEDFVNGTGGFACVLLLYVRITVKFWQEETCFFSFFLLFDPVLFF